MEEMDQYPLPPDLVCPCAKGAAVDCKVTQGLNQPNASGISSLQTWAKALRSIQLTLLLFY